ncbi:MAG: Piwi domain-containing protein, partial [Bacteroidales bacterium]
MRRNRKRMKINQKNLLIDIFKVNTEAIPPLFAYQIIAAEDNLSALGGKLAYKLKKSFNGVWIWCSGYLITDTNVSNKSLDDYLKYLWTTGEDFKSIQKINACELQMPLEKAQADFAAHGLMANHEMEIRKLLVQESKYFNKVEIRRDYSLHGLVIEKVPALSICVTSSIEHTQNLAKYASSVENLDVLIGMMVVVMEQQFKGEICEITGSVSEKREWLLSQTSEEKTREHIQKAPDNEIVVKIKTRTSKYEYIASMLRPIVRMEDLKIFDANPTEVLKVLRIDQEKRFALVEKIADVCRNKKIITERFEGKIYSQCYLNSENINFAPELMVGNNGIHDYNSNKRIMDSLKLHGVYRRAHEFADEDKPIRIAVLNATVNTSGDELKKYLTKMKNLFAELHFSIESVKVDGQSQIRIQKLDRVNLEKTINHFAKYTPHVLLALFPGSSRDEVSGDEEQNVYHLLKAITMREGIPSQVVYEDTFKNDYALDNIVLGILAKAGNIPFVLSKPFDYADMVVGIDIARKAKQKLSGSVNAIATARIYLKNGELLRYSIYDAPVEGETIPKKVLQGLFPLKEFEGKTVIIHRDGPFRGDEKKVLLEWAEAIHAHFKLVEVIKTGAPRMYKETLELFDSQEKIRRIEKPDKGTIFKMSNNEAFLVSSLPPFSVCTPRPLHVKTVNVPIEEALHSILSLTLLHYGSVREPRLPVSIHYSDKSAEFSLAGIKPKILEGTIP